LMSPLGSAPLPAISPRSLRKRSSPIMTRPDSGGTNLLRSLTELFSHRTPLNVEKSHETDVPRIWSLELIRTAMLKQSPGSGYRGVITPSFHKNARKPPSSVSLPPTTSPLSFIAVPNPDGPPSVPRSLSEIPSHTKGCVAESPARFDQPTT